jgi:hypothetical protein
VARVYDNGVALASSPGRRVDHNEEERLLMDMPHPILNLFSADEETFANCRL